MQNRKISLKEISEIIHTDYYGESITINGFNYADYTSMYDSILTYCLNYHYIKKALEKSNFGAIITTEKLYNNLKTTEKKKVSYFLVNDPVSTFFYLHNYLYKNTNFYSEFDFPKKIGENCKIHPSAIIEDGVKIGDNITIGANVIIKKGNFIEDNVSIGANSVIGSESLEVKKIKGKLTHIKHVGGVHIKKDAYIGSNSFVGRNLFEGFCTIGSETFIDNSVYIAHNNNIGNRNIITAGVSTAGSVTIGNNCFIGIGSKISNFIKIGNNVKINIGSVVVESIKDNQVIAGYYAMPNDAWLLKTISDKKKYKMGK